MQNYKTRKRIKEVLLIGAAFSVGYVVGVRFMRDAMFNSFKTALDMAAELVQEVEKAS